MSEVCFSRLDQALDPYAQLFTDTAEGYDRYLQQHYQDSYLRFRAGWDAHYQEMRTATLDELMRVVEGRQGGRSETAMALMGPGYDVVNRDLGQQITEAGISRLRQLVVVDFSISVIRDALSRLCSAHVDRDKLHGMQYDITGGLSTVYEQWWEEQLSGVDSEDALARAMDNAAQTDVVANLEGRLADALSNVRQGKVLRLDELPPTAPTNTKRSLKLSLGKEPLRLDYVQTNMVMAGTGETGESQFFEKFDVVTASTDSSRGSVPNEEILSVRRQILEDAHRIIAAYNTHILVIGTSQILQDNPKAHVVHLSDVSTTYKDARLALGSLPRLVIIEAQRRLRQMGIALRDLRTWKWDDEKTHSHSVHAMGATVAPKKASD